MKGMSEVGTEEVSCMQVMLLGFRPWVDSSCGIAVLENPSELVAKSVFLRLLEEGVAAGFCSVEVSAEGIEAAMSEVRISGASVVVALGQTRGAPRVERMGRVPGEWTPARAGEPQPWMLIPNPSGLLEELNTHTDPIANTGPFTISDDAGGYFCDHLCVELARDSRIRGNRALFLHLSAIQDLPPLVRQARLSQYEAQVFAAVEWAAAGNLSAA